MNAMQPEQAAFLLQLALPAAKNEHRTTRSVIEAIPADKGDYRPDAMSRSAMELAWHIAAAEHRFYSGIAAGQFDFTPSHRPENVRTSAEIGQWYGDSFSKNFEKLCALQGDHLSKPIDFRGMFQLPAISYFEISLRHSIHHRGQLSAYLRAMGGRVPAIYGESYDSAEAKKAAQAG
ncbi:MAG TPA: DinB family protein [Candidatus Acidoferrum sp.]